MTTNKTTVLQRNLATVLQQTFAYHPVSASRGIFTVINRRIFHHPIQTEDTERAELPPPISEGRGATFRKVLLCCREDFFNISNLSIR
jgi:hypothetical protein